MVIKLKYKDFYYDVSIFDTANEMKDKYLNKKHDQADLNLDFDAVTMPDDSGNCMGCIFFHKERFSIPVVIHELSHAAFHIYRQLYGDDEAEFEENDEKREERLTYILSDLANNFLKKAVENNILIKYVDI